MALIYILGTLTVFFFNICEKSLAHALVFTSAFSPLAAVGGFAGASVFGWLFKMVWRVVCSQTNRVFFPPIAQLQAKTKMNQLSKV